MKLIVSRKGTFAVKAIKASAGGICYTSDVMGTVSRAPVLPSPAPAIAGVSVHAPAPATPVFNTSVTCHHHHRFSRHHHRFGRHHYRLGRQRCSHCRRRSSPRRHRYRRLRAHRCLRHPAATAHGDAADIRPHPLEDGEIKPPGAPSQRRAPVDDEQDCTTVDSYYGWSRRRRLPQ